jgi:hypothetical protein
MNILIIGCGSIGCRHLEAILKYKASKINIHVVEPNKEIIESVKKIPNEYNYKITFVQLNESVKNPFLTIIATPSNIRFKILQELEFHNIQTKHLILEKFLFNKSSDYKYAQSIISNICQNKTYVNCPWRVYSGVKKLKQFLKKKYNSIERFKFFVSGKNWNMASNSIHFLDMCNFFFPLMDFNTFSVTDDIGETESKHGGYNEIYGKITFFDAISKSQINFESTLCASKNIEIFIKIFIDDDTFFLIDLSKDSIYLNDDFLFKLGLQYQSNLTNQYLHSLVNNKDIGLIDFDTSCKLHLKFLSIPGINNLQIT